MWIPFGYISGVAGTPKRLTANQTAPNEGFLCHAIFIQQVRTNTGFLLIGTPGLNESTGAGLNAVLAIPTDNSLPSAMVGISESPNALNAAEYVVDWTVTGDKALVSVLVM